jgi:hypothetical protein
MAHSGITVPRKKEKGAEQGHNWCLWPITASMCRATWVGGATMQSESEAAPGCACPSSGQAQREKPRGLLGAAHVPGGQARLDRLVQQQ